MYKCKQKIVTFCFEIKNTFRLLSLNSNCYTEATSNKRFKNEADLFLKFLLNLFSSQKMKTLTL